MSTIFDSLVTTENDHTNLLRSIMERDPKIASMILTFLTGSAISELIAASLEYRNQRTFAAKEGREIPDIFVEGKTIECLIEAKVDPFLGLTEKQRKGYLGCFHSDQKAKHLCLLVPLRWKHTADIESVRRTLQQRNISLRVSSWTNLARELGSRISEDSVSDVLREVAHFWNWRFEADPMTDHELQILRSWSGETYSAVRKLERTVDQLKAIYDAEGIKTEKDTDRTWYGFYLKRGEHYVLWIGIWADAPAPLCFGYEVDKAEWITPSFPSAEGQLIKKNRVWTLPPETWDSPERAYEILKQVVKGRRIESPSASTGRLA